MRRDIPRRRHCERVNMPNLSEGDHIAVGPASRPQGVAIDPVSGRRVAANLEVFAQLLIAYRSPFGQKDFDLLQDQRDPLDRGGVMGLLKPDAAPDTLRLRRGRQAAETLTQFGDLYAEPLVQRGA